MTDVLRVLILEASRDDSERLLRALHGAHVEPVCVPIRCFEDVRAALRSRQWDVVIGDHSLPDLHFIEVLALLDGRVPQTPLIVVSTAIGEEQVVETLLSGAASDVDKARLSSLVPMIERVVGEARANDAHLRTQRELELVRAAVNGSNDLIFVLEFVDGRPAIVHFVNDAAARVTGYATEDFYENNLLRLRGPETDPAAIARLRAAMKRGEAAESELLTYRKDGSTLWLECQIRPLAPGSRTFVSCSRDITERKKLEAQMAHMATHDALTGLPNRALLNERLAHEIAHARREGHEVAVLLVDLDEFKGINDTLGHARGDDVLREVAARLRSCVRECDTVARLGGDEFVIVAGGVERRETIVHLANRALATLRQPFDVEGDPRHLSASIGVAFYPVDGDGGNALLKSADLAMYRAKRAGKNACRLSERAGLAEAVELA